MTNSGTVSSNGTFTTSEDYQIIMFRNNRNDERVILNVLNLKNLSATPIYVHINEEYDIQNQKGSKHLLEPEDELYVESMPISSICVHEKASTIKYIGMF